MSYNAKNYVEQGGNVTHIGGKLIIDEGGSLEGFSSLPAVTSDDNGDVLTVVEGEWAKAEPSGGDVTVTALAAVLEGCNLALTSGYSSVPTIIFPVSGEAEIIKEWISQKSSVISNTNYSDYITAKWLYNTFGPIGGPWKETDLVNFCNVVVRRTDSSITAMDWYVEAAKTILNSDNASAIVSKIFDYYKSQKKQVVLHENNSQYVANVSFEDIWGAVVVFRNYTNVNFIYYDGANGTTHALFFVGTGFNNGKRQIRLAQLNVGAGTLNFDTDLWLAEAPESASSSGNAVFIPESQIV